MDRRSFVVGSAATVAALAPGPASGQDAYPSRAITLINPFPPDGAVETVGKPFATALAPRLGQPVTIESRVGAAGQVGARHAASAKPDGYTLLLHIVSLSGFAAVDELFGRKPQFTRADFIPIARFTEGPMALLVNDRQPYRTLKELVDDARKRPNEIVFASSGHYGALHLPTALFMKAAGIRMHHLPTNGGGPALAAVLGNNAQVLASSIAAASSHLRTGKARALACFSANRAASLPGVPTLRELGYDVQFSLWVGLFAPKGTPGSVIARLREETRRVVRSEVFGKAVESVGDAVAYLDQPAFARFWHEDARRVEEAVRSIGKL